MRKIRTWLAVPVLMAATFVPTAVATGHAANAAPAVQAVNLAPAVQPAYATPVINSPHCQGGADPGWFCAYEYQGFTGESRGMYNCGNYFIPWYTTGSWDNEQTPGTRPWAYFVSSSPWHMPAADSFQKTGVSWSPVNSITNC